jgi:RNA polymerase sigma factor (sigma-70 family)
MSLNEHTEHLSEIPTSWTKVFAAHHPDEALRLARRQLFERYEVPVRKYLYKALREEIRDDENAAEECFQTFALKVLDGGFLHANPEGSFRKYLKTAVINLVHDYREKQRRRGLPLSPDTPEPPAKPQPAEGLDDDIEANLRKNMILRALEALKQHDREKGQHLYTVLELRMNHPEMKLDQMAERLPVAAGDAHDAQWVARRLYNARLRMGGSLIDEVAAGLDNPSLENIEEELRDLGLLEHCRLALRKRFGRRKK